MAVFTASLGGLVLGQTDEFGVLYTLGEIVGWDSPVSTGDVTTRTDARGGWVSRAHLAPRIMAANGTLSAPADGMLDAAIDRLLDAVPFDVAGPMVVTRDGPARLCNVRQDGEPDISIITRRDATYSIPLIAPDPLRYSSAESSVTLKLANISGGLTIPLTAPFSIGATSSTGTAAVNNDGNFETGGTITIYGPVTDPSITNATTGDRLTFTGAIAAGDYLVIDVDRRTVLLNGVASRRGNVTGQFPAFARGLNTVSFTAPSYDPAASAVIAWRSAWK